MFLRAALLLAVLVAACSAVEPTTAPEATVGSSTTIPVTANSVATSDASATQSPTAPSDLFPASLVTAIDEWAADNQVAALVVGVATPSGEVHTIAASSIGSPPDEDALFEVGSLTKTVVAATVLALVDDDVLDLDATIDQWLPDFPAADVITLRHLLGHTAGLRERFEPPSLDDLFRLAAPVPVDELLTAAAAAVTTEPGQHVYVNSGYWVVGAVVEAATQRSLAEVIAENVVVPMEMDDTYMAWSAELPSPLVPGELAFGDGLEALTLPDEPLVGLITGAWSAGGVVSTAADMATFYSALPRAGVFSADLVAEMLHRDDVSMYGLGVEYRPVVEAWGHNGAIPGYTSSALVEEAPDGYAVVVLTNRMVVAGRGLEPDTERFAGTVLELARSLRL